MTFVQRRLRLGRLGRAKVLQAEGQHSAPAPLLWLATYRSDGSWHTGYRPVNTRYPTRRLIRGGGAPAHPSRSNCESLPGRGEGASVLVCVPRLPDTHNPVAHAIHARYDAVRHRTNSSAAPLSDASRPGPPQLGRGCAEGTGGRSGRPPTCAVVVEDIGCSCAHLDQTEQLVQLV